MNKLEKSHYRNVTVINELGLHARPAGLIAKLAKKAESNVWLVKDGEKVDASSIIDILSLACLKDSKIVLQIDNPADIDVLNKIVELFDNGFKG